MKNTWLALSLPAIALLVSTGAALQPNKEEERWRHRVLGKAYFENPTTPGEAVTELKKALDLQPGSIRDRLNYGLALLRAGETQQSVPELLAVQKADPKLPHTWFNLGIAYRRLNRIPEAIAQFQGMVRLTPDEPVAHHNLGLLYGLQDREPEALKEFETAARLDPNMVAPRYQIFNIYRFRGAEKDAEKALAEFRRVKTARDQAGEEKEDTEWCTYAELYDPIEARPAPALTGPAPAIRFKDETLAGTADAATAGMLVIDAFGEHASDLLVWSSRGATLYRRGRTAVADSGLAALRDVVGVAAGDYDNDGLADLCVLTRQSAVLLRNAKGRFLPSSSTLPAGNFQAAVWLDFDHDYDLDLLLFGEHSTLVRNEGEGKFAAAEGRFPFQTGQAIAAAPFRVEPDSKGMDLAVTYANRGAVLYRDRLRGSYDAMPLDAIPAGARSLAAADVDNDGRPDLVWATAAGPGLALNRIAAFVAGTAPACRADAVILADLENRGFADLVAADSVCRNAGLARFDPPRKAATLAQRNALAAADFDADGRIDLAAVAPDGVPHLLVNQTATNNRWMAIALEGMKNLKSAMLTEVEVRTGSQYQKAMYQGTPLLFGVGPSTIVDMVRLSWPNGMIQGERSQPTAKVTRIVEQARLSGSCPIVFTWDGRRFRHIADVLGTAPLGASSGDGGFFPVDSDEYLQIPAGALAPRDGAYEVRVTEELHEVTYLDQARLIAVDHPSDTEIVTNDKFKSPPFPEFRLFGVKRRIFPRQALDSRGRDALPALFERDRAYVRDFRRTGGSVAEMHALELRFPQDVARDNRAVLVLNGWIDWADGSTFLAASQRGPGLVMPYLQVRDGSGQWQTVIEDMGVPSGGPKTIAVDLSGKFLSASRDVRIVTNVCLYWDQIYLSEDTSAPSAQLTAIEPRSADLRLRGFSRAIVSAPGQQPETYEYAAWRPEAMWDPVPGRYTRYGDVRELVLNPDDMFVIFGSGDEVRLQFDVRGLPPLAPGWTRDFLLHVDGWSKDADPNTAFSDSVDPLPFHGMSRYPYPEQERFPDDPAHRNWRKQYNTRNQLKILPALTRSTSRSETPVK